MKHWKHPRVKRNAAKRRKRRIEREEELVRSASTFSEQQSILFSLRKKHKENKRREEERVSMTPEERHRQSQRILRAREENKRFKFFPEMKKMVEEREGNRIRRIIAFERIRIFDEVWGEKESVKIWFKDEWGNLREVVFEESLADMVTWRFVKPFEQG